jgi:hypothetical protein
VAGILAASEWGEMALSSNKSMVRARLRPYCFYYVPMPYWRLHFKAPVS